MLDLLLSMVETEDDAELVTRLVKEYERRMFSIAFSIIHNVSDAEDVVQDTFLKVIKHLDKIRGKTIDEAGVYISAITRNVAIDLHNRKKKEDIIDPEKYTVLPDKYDDVEDIALTSISYEELRKIILRLNKTDYEIIYLKYFMELSISDIADMLNISGKTASQRLYAAKRNLKKRLEKRGGHDE